MERLFKQLQDKINYGQLEKSKTEIKLDKNTFKNSKRLKPKNNWIRRQSSRAIEKFIYGYRKTSKTSFSDMEGLYQGHKKQKLTKQPPKF